MTRIRQFLRFSAAIFLAFLFCFFAPLQAGGQIYADESANYTTESFTIHTTVAKNHTMHVKETIVVDFGSHAHHGIYRYIPYSEKQYIVTNENAGDDPLNTSTESEYGSGYKVLRIGDEDKTVTGEHTYHISYDLVCYKDDSKINDYLSYDLFPTDWETSVGTVTSTLTLPKSMDWDDLEFYSGSYGAEDPISDYFTQTIDKENKTIILMGDNVPSGVGATVKADLPEGYWVDPPSRASSIKYLWMAITIIPAVAAVLWFKYGRDPQIVETVEFEPPEGMTPCEIGYIIDGSAENKDVLSMIMYYADRGYLSIEEKEEDHLVLIKKTEADPKDPKFSRYFYKHLFNSKKTKDLSNLPDSFGKIVENTKEKVKEQFAGDDQIYNKQANFCRGLTYVLFALMILIVSFVTGYYSYTTFLCIFLPIIVLLPSIFGLVMVNMTFDRRKSMTKAKIGIIRTIGIVLLVIGGGIFGSFIFAWVSAAAAIGCVAAYVIMVLCSVFMRSLTKHGAELMGKILGFRRFIETAEYDRLKALSDQDPEYFFHIMPYAYVMGMDKTWAKKFEEIQIGKPDWYDGYDSGMVYSSIWYSSLFHTYTHQMNSALIQSGGDTTGGGGFSGGGFSGGGFGGGGGGAW
ncbi:DUF2207 domain-containing protein [Catenisphaera adipataccumulans]|jgi:uncharacterized membrane protein|uniref:Putative membrane protein n=1 Tax=Catenisphaera adipataccumulans TaxID=700500 RepID=A0A7W8CYG4_9FIRM|nr:DUF2207 domain-containing protein [Catenisphaera adipataccumulans]MBB5182719.1 putative membrane protein [Catenisphaera adipataccumulans]